MLPSVRICLSPRVCLLSAHKTVPCWRISVPTVGAQESFSVGAKGCSLSARRARVSSGLFPVSARTSVHCLRTIVFTLGAHESSLLAQKRAHCRRTRVSLIVGAQVCSLSAHTSAPCWRTSASTVDMQDCPRWRRTALGA